MFERVRRPLALVLGLILIPAGSGCVPRSRFTPSKQVDPAPGPEIHGWDGIRVLPRGTYIEIESIDGERIRGDIIYERDPGEPGTPETGSPPRRNELLVSPDALN